MIHSDRSISIPGASFVMSTLASTAAAAEYSAHVFPICNFGLVKKFPLWSRQSTRKTGGGSIFGYFRVNFGLYLSSALGESIIDRH
jgi:hypothetical protein